MISANMVHLSATIPKIREEKELFVRSSEALTGLFLGWCFYTKLQIEEAELEKSFS